MFRNKNKAIKDADSRKKEKNKQRAPGTKKKTIAK